MLNNILFFLAAFVAVATTIMVVSSRSPVHAVLYLIMSLFGVSVVFYTLGSPFLAVLEVIVYAGAIMVLFLFVVMMLNLGGDKPEPDLEAPKPKNLLVPVFFAGLLLLLTITVLLIDPARGTIARVPTMEEFALVLYRKHYLGVELASLVLLIGIIGGMHLGRAARFETDEPEVVPHADR